MAEKLRQELIEDLRNYLYDIRVGWSLTWEGEMPIIRLEGRLNIDQLTKIRTFIIAIHEATNKERVDPTMQDREPGHYE